MILLVSGIEAFAFITLVIVVLIAIGVLFFLFLKTDRRRGAGSDEPGNRGS